MTARSRARDALAGAAAAAALVVLFIRMPPLANRLVAALVAVGVITLVAAHRRTALAMTLVFVAVQEPVLAYAYARGVPAPVVRNLGFLKEVVTAGLLYAAMTRPERNWHLAVVDKLVLAFVGISTLFLVIPVVLPEALGGLPFGARFVAFRSSTLFLVLFFACRRLPWSASDFRFLCRAFGFAALLMVPAVVWQRYFNQDFVRLTLTTLQIPTYLINVLGRAVDASFLVRIRLPEPGAGGLRAGGWLYDALSLGFYLVLALALSFSRHVRARVTPSAWLTTAALAFALLLTLTRSAVAGGVVALILVLSQAFRQHLVGRFRLLAITVLGALLLAPFWQSTHIVERVSSAVQGTDVSTSEHVSGSSRALSSVLHHPAGVGLGTGGEAQIGVPGAPATAENAYLQVGVELGLAPMLLFVWIVLATQRALKPRGSPEVNADVLGIWAAGWGLAFTGLFLHVWLNFPVATSFWALAGVASALRATPPGTPDTAVSRLDREPRPGVAAMAPQR